MNPRYLLGSSFFDGGKGGREYRREFSIIWRDRIAQLKPRPTRTVIICQAGSQYPFPPPFSDVINLTGDLGACGQLLNGTKTNEFSGWSAAMLALALIAYNDESDLLYIEEDCLAFGPFIERMYQDMGDGSLVFGPKHQSAPWQVCSQSLFLVRFEFIPKFVAAYISMGKDGDKDNLGEMKFVRMEEQFGKDVVKRLSFGFDRERPIRYEDEVFYAQQITPDELAELKRRQLI
jgi:hypothetical protein